MKIKSIRTAEPVPIDPKSMGDIYDKSNLIVNPIGQRDLPYTGIREIKEIIKNIGGDLVSELGNPSDVIMLPSIYKADPNKIVEINGTNYYILDVKEPRDVGRKSTIDGKEYLKGDRYPGKIFAFDIDNKKIVDFPFDGVAETIQMPSENKQKIMLQMNLEIEKYNKKIDEIAKSVGMSRIALQIGSAEDHVDERIKTIESMISSFERRETNEKLDFASHEEWLNSIFEKVKNNEMNALDAFHTILYKYQNKPEELISDINNSSFPISDNIKRALIDIATKEVENKKLDEESRKQKLEERTTRKEEELDLSTIEDMEETKIQPIEAKDIPSGKYTELESYRRPENLERQIYRAKESLTRDLNELKEVKASLVNLRSYIGGLEKGQRAKDFLASTEGQTVVKNVKISLDKIALFRKRYKEEIIQDGKINSALFGTKGKSLGNALLAVTLSKVIVPIYETIKPYLATTEPPMPPSTSEAEETTTETGIEANKKHDLTKFSMNEAFWNSFINLYKKNVK